MEDRISRNYTLDIIKLFAAFLVVFIHVPFYGIVGDIVKLFARVAVPIFFMTSGYFSYENDSLVLLRKVKKIMWILIFTSALYNLMNLMLEIKLYGKAGIIDYFAQFLNVDDWLKLLFFNEPFSATRLWFLFALIYVYLMQGLFNRARVSYKIIEMFVICGLLIHIALGSVIYNLGIDVPEYLCRNFLFVGYPFFGLGLLFKHYESKVIKTSKMTLIVCTIIGCLLSIIPLLYDSVSQICVGTLFLLYAIFSFAIKKSETPYPRWAIEFSKCSLGIYIFHRPVTTVIGNYLPIIRIQSGTVLFEMLLPILVCVFTTLFVLMIRRFGIFKN